MFFETVRRRTLQGLWSLMVASLTGCWGGCDPKPVKPVESKVVVRELQKIEVQTGKGPEAAVGKRAEVAFTEMTVHGKIIQSNLDAKKRELIAVNPAENPPGLGAFIVGMRVGGRRRVTVPFGESFGNRHESGEPLIYEIELVAIKD
jgi:FKBP-type peptidyl-prolyl cis-trans isomerase